MFNFLNSSILFAAAAALIPLLIHLFSKRKVKVVEFPSLRHLQAMQKKQVRRLKIKQLILLILRMLIILMVVLAFARPTTESGNIGSQASVAAVLLFDNSASMNRDVIDGNLFEIAKRKTIELLDTFEEDDQIYLLPLVTPDRDQAALQPLSATRVKELLLPLPCSYSTASLPTRLEQAVSLLDNAQQLNKELYLITDRQTSVLTEDIPPLPLEGIDTYLMDLPMEPVDNLGLTALSLGGEMILPGHEFTLAATVKNYGEETSENRIASLYLNNIRVAQHELTLRGGGDLELTFRQAVNRTGYHTGFIELSGDKFISDNRYYFSFYIPEQFSLLIIDGDQTGGLMNLALIPSETLNRYWSVKIARLDQLESVRFWEYDVIILAGAPALSDSYWQRLESYLRRGKSLLVTYGADTDINLFNDTYGAFSGIRYTEPVKNQFTRAGYYSFDTYDPNHPIFSGM